MTIARELLGRYLRQRADLGEKDLLLERLTPDDLHRLVQAVRSVGPGPSSVISVPPPESASPGSRPVAPETPAPSAEPHRPGLHLVGTESLVQLGTLDELRSVALGCPRCRLSETRSHVVFGEGSPTAELMVVGEAPGAEEDRSGRPFVGRAGKLLDLLLAAVGFSRESVYICNVLKCRPPGNRNPEAEEIEACSPYLRRQVELVRPRAILAVGGFAAQTLLGSTTPIGRLRGTVHEFEGVPLVPSYHPAALLRNPVWVRPVWEDLQRLRSVLDQA
jgi:uracil-DNA glycosylase